MHALQKTKNAHRKKMELCQSTTLMPQKIKIAILDDYQNIALSMADWTALDAQTEVTVFSDHIANEDELIARLKPFEIICVMRERTPLTQNIFSSLPNLKLVVSTGFRNASIDLNAAAEANVVIKNTGYHWSGAPELTWALLMSIARKITEENESLRLGGWQTTVGTDLSGKTIGILGLGNIGQKIASYAHVFDMKVIAWSPNLTAEKAKEHNATLVSKKDLFKEADFVTIHMVLSSHSKDIVDAPELKLMKPSAYLINTSRGPLVNEAALINALEQNTFAGAALDVFDREPLNAEHPFRKLKNVLATPHIGYGTEDTYRLFFTDTVNAIEAYLKTAI
jgi:phosphoglycerate dehydrogenase-like enzyme